MCPPDFPVPLAWAAASNPLNWPEAWITFRQKTGDKEPREVPDRALTPANGRQRSLPSRKAQRDRIRRRGIAAVILLAVPVGAALGLFLWFSRDLPSTDDLMSVRPWVRTVLYDVRNRPIKAFYEEDRVIVPLDEMPAALIDAFIAVEDRQFYRHWGLNLFAIGKALAEDVVARKVVRGASTITQQLARNLFLTQEQTVTRKLKEAILAVRLERHYTKKEILSMYLNQIYFGGGAHGIEAAAQTFFGKSAKDLSVGESTLLAGLP